MTMPFNSNVVLDTTNKYHLERLHFITRNVQNLSVQLSVKFSEAHLKLRCPKSSNLIPKENRLLNPIA